MKKTLAVLLTVASLASAGTIYPTTCIITNCDEQNDTVTINTGTGITYEFEGVEDYNQGDLVSCIMFDNFTPDDIRDDVIIAKRYGGSFELFESITK